MFISTFNYICLMGCSPQEMPRCWHVGGFGKLSTFCLTDREFKQFFMEMPFVSFYTVADSVTQQIRTCPEKRKRPPLVRGHRITSLSVSTAFLLRHEVRTASDRFYIDVVRGLGFLYAKI